jgi:hypothetical protein
MELEICGNNHVLTKDKTIRYNTKYQQYLISKYVCLETSFFFIGASSFCSQSMPSTCIVNERELR